MINRSISLLFVLLTLSLAAFAQEVHDFRNDTRTAPIATSVYLPGTCSYGELRQIYQIAPAVPNLYQCGYSNDWHLFSGGTGASLPTTGNLFYGDGAGGALATLFAPSAVVLTSGSYGNPVWITALDGSKITGDGNAAHYLDGTGNYSAPPGGSGASSTIQLSDLTPSLSTGTLTVQAGRIRFGTNVCTNFTSSATASITSMSGGTGVAKLYVASSCALVIEYPSALTVTWSLPAGAISAMPTAVPAVPASAFYLGDISIGTSTITAVTDKRAVIGQSSVVAGSGIVADCTLGPCLISTDTGTVPLLGGVNAYTGTQDASGASTTKPARTVGSDPSGSCSNNNEIVLSTASGNSFSCLSGTWHAMGGSGSSASQYLSTSPASTTTGSGDTVIAVTGTLPALAAGACWDYETFLTSNGNAAVTALKVWYGTTPGTTGSSLTSDAVSVNPSQLWIRGQICNNTGVQNAQTATMFPQFKQAAGGFGAAGSMNQNTTATNLKIGITWAAADVINVQSFRVWLTQ